jgi:hypothetical protein
MNQLKRQINRAKIAESLSGLDRNTRSNSSNFHRKAIQFLQIRIETDRILSEIYAN